MSAGGTARYRALDRSTVPPLVSAAVGAADELSFDLCVHPATGRLLQSLGGGVPAGGRVAEIGTGTGAGLAWLSSFAGPDVAFISIELDADRAAAAQAIFAGVPNVTVLNGDAGELYAQGPFDLLVFDGGWGSGKSGDDPVDLASVVETNGLFTIDDLTPMTDWPPRFEGDVDRGRQYWLTHPDVLATEIQVAADLAVLVGRHTPGWRSG